MRGVKKIILENYFLFILVLTVYNYFFWYANILTNYYFEKKSFKKNLGYKLNLKNPRSFNEKVVYKKIHDRNPLLTRTADKYSVRSYVKEVLGEKEGEKILIPLLYVTDKPKTIPFEKLPKDFVIKANHGSGWNIIVRNGKYNKKEIIKKCEAWLNTPFGLEKMEWAYKDIKRKIVIEEFIQDEKGKSPKDYKFFVFHGKCKMIQVDSDRFEEHTRSLFDENFNYLDMSLKFKQGKKIKPPKKYKEMKKLAEKIVEKFEFARIDLYTTKNKIYLGEITHYPETGNGLFTPIKKDRELGKNWKIKRNYWKK